MKLSFCPLPLVLLLAAPLAGCGRDDVRVYRVARENQPAPASAAGTANVPAGWEEAPPGEMRVASFRVKGKDGERADVSVIPLPGLAGHDLDNVNRWRGQLGLQPLAETELSKAAQPVQVGGLDGQLYELSGSNPASGARDRMLAVILHREGVAWFFKMTGPDALVAEQKPTFVSYLKSFNFPTTGGQAASGEVALPLSHPPIGNLPPAAASAAGTTLGDGKPDWQVPAGWKEIPGGQFLVAKFAISGPNESQATVNVSNSQGDGGGLAANVNRWRGQLGLGQLPDGEVLKIAQSIDLPAGKASLVDITGKDPRTGQDAHMLATIVPMGSQTWFYKLMGPDQLVTQNKDAFLTFVRSAKYHQ